MLPWSLNVFFSFSCLVYSVKPLAAEGTENKNAPKILYSNHICVCKGAIHKWPQSWGLPCREGNFSSQGILPHLTKHFFLGFLFLLWAKKPHTNEKRFGSPPSRHNADFSFYNDREKLSLILVNRSFSWFVKTNSHKLRHAVTIRICMKKPFVNINLRNFALVTSFTKISYVCKFVVLQYSDFQCLCSSLMMSVTCFSLR